MYNKIYFVHNINNTEKITIQGQGLNQTYVTKRKKKKDF